MIKGNYQYHWNDSWDWAAMNAPALIDFKRNGETIRGAGQPAAQRLHVLAHARKERRDRLRAR